MEKRMLFGFVGVSNSVASPFFAGIFGCVFFANISGVKNVV